MGGSAGMTGGGGESWKKVGNDSRQPLKLQQLNAQGNPKHQCSSLGSGFGRHALRMGRRGRVLEKVGNDSRQPLKLQPIKDKKTPGFKRQTASLESHTVLSVET
jgi:hypothetical protein